METFITAATYILIGPSGPNCCGSLTGEYVKLYLKHYKSPNSDNENTMLKKLADRTRDYLIDLTTCTDNDHNIIKCISELKSVWTGIAMYDMFHIVKYLNTQSQTYKQDARPSF